MSMGLIGIKVGMTRLYDEAGLEIPCSVIHAGPCLVTQLKNEENDAYSALQVGFHEKKDKHTSKPLQGHFKKSGIKAQQHLKEFRLTVEEAKDYELGQEIKVDIFKLGDVVDITGNRKGRGFQGVVKRHHFKGLNETHGAKDYKRRPGSMGGSSYPSKVWKGKKLPGRMGTIQKTIQNLKVVKVDLENNLIAISGAVPGPNGGVIYINKAVKG